MTEHQKKTLAKIEAENRAYYNRMLKQSAQNGNQHALMALAMQELVDQHQAKLDQQQKGAPQMANFAQTEEQETFNQQFISEYQKHLSKPL